MPGEDVRVPINSDQDIILARQRGRSVAAEAGFSAVDATLIATAISELARNIVSYARSGELSIHIVQEAGRRGICITAMDSGPGIADVQQPLYAQHVRSMHMQQHAQPDPEAHPVERIVEHQ